MSARITPLALMSLTVSLGACASTQARPGAEVAAAGATYSCVLAALRGGPLPVVKADSAQGFVLAQLREDVAIGSPRISGGQIGSPAGSGDYEQPYTIDLVTARVHYDAAQGRSLVDVQAASGTGSSAKGGWVPRPARDVAQQSARAARACAG